MKTHFLFFGWPYIAIALLVVGIVVRYLLTRRQMPAVVTEVKEAKAAFGGSRLWRVALLLLVVGHVVSLLFPRLILWWDTSAGRLYLLEFSSFIIGLLALVSFARLLWRQLGQSSRSALVELSDMVFLSLIFIGLISGLLMAGLYRWGSSWGVITLTPYVTSLLRLKPATQFAEQMPFLVRIHLFSTFAALAVLPLTRLAAIPVVALHFCLGMIGRPATRIGAAAEAWLRRRNPAAWLWPEVD